MFIRVRITLTSFLCLSYSFARRSPCLLSLVLFFSSVLLLLLCFDIILDLNINCKMNTKNSQITFTQNPQTLTFYHICVITPFSVPSLCLQHNLFLNHLRVSFRHDVLLMQVLQIIQSRKTRTLGHSLTQGLPDGSLVKKLHTNAGNIREERLIPGSGRSPRGGNGNPHQDSCQGNPTDRGAWWAIVHAVTMNRM